MKDIWIVIFGKGPCCGAYLIVANYIDVLKFIGIFVDVMIILFVFLLKSVLSKISYLSRTKILSVSL